MATESSLPSGRPHGGLGPLRLLLVTLLVPVTVASIVYRHASSNDAERPLVWAGATFFAGLTDMGVGSIIVGLLYFAVRKERTDGA
ncbi:hypothetical protein AUR64_06000 [Haloprofundus marisrubri]|uniref:Uncharacterized protein n=1 Tax=Haloprofundus marisrubri TaxID=1514971 RepID=A0A0W1RB67_9EURY|nr:hypothetical protein [Haloprofundus marisrubri]KTG10743.1 hypothetical protein AUR64_06000 [Haloprofundus marisrubri]